MRRLAFVAVAVALSSCAGSMHPSPRPPSRVTLTYLGVAGWQISDGTHVIRFVNPDDFSTIRTISVNDERGQPLMELNELEYVKGEIWANVWETGWIVRIDPATGKLLGRIDLNSLAQDVQSKNKRADVLNGIAYDAATDRIFITGKLWPNLYEIKVNPK